MVSDVEISVLVDVGTGCYFGDDALWRESGNDGSRTRYIKTTCCQAHSVCKVVMGKMTDEVSVASCAFVILMICSVLFNLVASQPVSLLFSGDMLTELSAVVT
jgi:hypothetical protein